MANLLDPNDPAFNYFVTTMADRDGPDVSGCCGCAVALVLFAVLGVLGLLLFVR